MTYQDSRYALCMSIEMAACMSRCSQSTRIKMYALFAAQISHFTLDVHFGRMQSIL